MSQKEYALRHKLVGLCINCPRQLSGGSTIYCDYHREKSRARGKINGKRLSLELKLECLNHYGNRCACCGEDNIGFLSIDHVGGKGNNHRKALFKHNVGGAHMYRWIKKNNFPKEFKVLCMNCNWATRYGNVCPHKIIN